jgi:Flp pilus assembly protein TadB
MASRFIAAKRRRNRGRDIEANVTPDRAARTSKKICTKPPTDGRSDASEFSEERTARRRTPMSFSIYVVGYLILIAGIVYLAHLMHIPQTYIIAVAIILAGIGVVTGVSTTRQKDPS